MRIVSLFFISFILGFCANIVAQNPFIRHYTTSDGLPTNTIYQIYQDSHKFLWFTSDAGVIKYDGSNFISYRKKDGLSSNDVVRIKEDTRGRIWFFNYNASVNYLYENKIYNGKNAPFLNSLKGMGFFLDFFTDSHQNIKFYNWQREIFSLDTNNNVSKKLIFSNISYKLPLVEKNYDIIRVSYLNISLPDELTIWSSTGIYKEIISQEKISVLDSNLCCIDVFPARNNTNYVKRCVYQKQTNLYELLKVTGNFQKETISLPFNAQKIKTVLEDSEGYLWIAAYEEGVFCIKNNKVVRRFDIKDALGLFQDSEQNIWASSQSDGIYVINHDILEQKHYGNTYFHDHGIHTLCDSPGMGVWCINSNAAFLLKNNIFYALSIPGNLQPVNLVHLFKNQTLILRSSIRNTLCTFDDFTINTTSNNIGCRQNMYYNFFVKKIFNDRSGNVLAMFDQNKILVTNTIKPLLNIGYKDISERINNAYYNADNELVINAKENYLYKNNALVPYPELSRFDGTIISDHLVLSDSAELFNIDGDSLYVLCQHKFYNLTDAFDFPFDAQINKILYEDSTLYLTTLKDIFVCHNPLKVISGNPVHIQPLNNSFTNINDILIHKDTLYIASDDGLTVIPEASIATSIAQPPIPYLKSITVNDKVYSITDQELKLTGKNKIQLSFGCISYSSSSIIYSYMLEGIENKWTIGTGNGINLVYQDLPKGNYTFKLRVRKANSGWSKPLELSVNIKPTLVEYPAFRAVVVLIFSGVIFLIIFMIRIQKMKRVEIDHQMIVMEQKALQSMMNPHFIFNSLGSIQNYLLNNKGSEAVIYLTQFANLIRQNLNAINTPMIILEEEVDRLRNYIDLEQKRLENKFVYSIQIDNELEAETLYIPSMIIQPIAENAIWHGIATLEEKGVLKISFRVHNSNSLKIIIEDNGIGMKKSLEYSAKSSQHHHLGMQIIKKRLVLLSKKYKTKTSIIYSASYPNHQNQGTRVELIMPFIYNTEEF